MTDRLRSGHPPACDHTRHDIVSPGFFDNDTFYECRLCGVVWLGAPVAGLLHHYQLCDRCRKVLDAADRDP
jgi:hypothetical protein